MAEATSVDEKAFVEALQELTDALGDIEDVLKAMDYFLHTLASHGEEPQG
jgi:hypothetical protein